MNQFDIRARLFDGYARFIPLFEVVIIDNGNLSYGMSMSVRVIVCKWVGIMYVSCYGIFSKRP